MPWDGSILLIVGLSFYSVTLLMYSTTVSKLKFGSFINISLKTSDISHYRKLLGAIFMAASCVCISITFVNYINTSRKPFIGLLIYGVMLIVVRLSTLISNHISIFGLEIELISTFDTKLFKAFRSSFIIGGALLFILGALPFAVDAALLFDFSRQQKVEADKLASEVSKDKFVATYYPRHLNYGGQALSENKFIEALLPGRRFVLKGRAGIGKTTFLKKLRADFHKKHHDVPLIFIEARRLSCETGIPENFNKDYFKAMSWFSFPQAQHILERSLIIIDGIDEVGYESRGAQLLSIETMARNYPKSRIIVTTRPVGFEPLKGFEVVELEALDTIQTDMTLHRQRINKLFVAVVERLKSARIDEQFIRMLSVPPSIILEPLTLHRIETLFHSFLGVYRFDVRIVDRYAFLSTFRDIEIIENLFIQSLFGQLPMTAQSREFGRTQLYEHFLRQKIFENCHLKEGQEKIVNKALDEMTEICRLLYEDSDKKIMTFHFKREILHRQFGDDTFQRFIVASEILTEEGNGYKFDNKSIDEYFISRLIKKELDENPNHKSEIISRNDFYTGSEVLPFLIGHYEQIDEIMPDILVALSKLKGQKTLENYMSHDFRLFFLHIQRREKNFATLRQLNVPLAPSPKRIFDAQLREYLAAVTGD